MANENGLKLLFHKQPQKNGLWHLNTALWDEQLHWHKL